MHNYFFVSLLCNTSGSLSLHFNYTITPLAVFNPFENVTTHKQVVAMLLSCCYLDLKSKAKGVL